MNRLVVLPRALSQRLLSVRPSGAAFSDLSNRGMEEDPEHVSQRIAEESWEAMGGSGRGKNININNNNNNNNRRGKAEEEEKDPQALYEQGQREIRKKDVHNARVDHEMERTGLEKGKERDKDFPYEQTDINDESGGPARNPLP